ncbi:hypothetical protein C8034_v005661 [Colletotrichum sidae]|uniref:Uncharacterized protein n=1 Tax=Colletotrichum sidae TaxID=1347389 RepID=A0A4R8TS68_9PEZI|nr:hypothetical protein C8034_v005661 [Colletotrichum sidae]
MLQREEDYDGELERTPVEELKRMYRVLRHSAARHAAQASFMSNVIDKLDKEIEENQRVNRELKACVDEVVRQREILDRRERILNQRESEGTSKDTTAPASANIGGNANTNTTTNTNPT